MSNDSGDGPRYRLQRLQLIEAGDNLLLKRGRVVVKIEGAQSAQIAQGLLAIAAGGDLTRPELCAPFPEEFRPSAGNLVDSLVERRLLVDAARAPASDEGEHPIDIFFWHFDRSAADVAQALDKARVTVVGVNCVSRQLVGALLQAGIGSVEVVDYPLFANVRLFEREGQVSAAEWPARLGRPQPYREWLTATGGREAGCIVATSDFGGQQLLRDWNRHCVKESIPFLPVILQDLVGHVGPLVHPGETPCLECLRARENAHMDDPGSRRASEYGAYAGQVVNAFHPSMASVLGDIAAMELVKLYGQLMRSRLVGRVIEVNLVVPELRERRVLKIPRCTVCGTGGVRSPVSLNRSAFMPGHEAVQ
jgi:molybdopterin-synthase adenylyltransferase